MCISERKVKGEWSEEVHYFIGSRKMSAKEYGMALRKHWGIENNLHWQLDITFGEDANRVQRRHGAKNWAYPVLGRGVVEAAREQEEHEMQASGRCL